MSSARKRERPEWLKDHDDGSWLDERGAGDNEGDGDDEYVGDSSASAPKAKAPRPSAPKPKPKPPAAPAATMTVTTKEERSLLAKYEELRAVIDASRRTSCVIRLAPDEVPAPDRVKAAVAALARSNSRAFDPEEGQSGQLKRPSMKRRGPRPEIDGAPPVHDGGLHSGWPEEDNTAPAGESNEEEDGGMLSAASFARARAEEDGDPSGGGGAPPSMFPPQRRDEDEGDSGAYDNGGFDSMW